MNLLTGVLLMLIGLLLPVFTYVVTGHRHAAEPDFSPDIQGAIGMIGIEVKKVGRDRYCIVAAHIQIRSIINHAGLRFVIEPGSSRTVPLEALHGRVWEELRIHGGLR